jgi:predicted DNA-binding transcriptional regulator AlpA
MQIKEKRWLSISELKEEFGFSESWQAKARMSSSKMGLPFCKIGGKFIKYDRNEINKWLELHMIKGVKNEC